MAPPSPEPLRPIRTTGTLKLRPPTERRAIAAERTVERDGGRASGGRSPTTSQPTNQPSGISWRRWRWRRRWRTGKNCQFDLGESVTQSTLPILRPRSGRRRGAECWTVVGPSVLLPILLVRRPLAGCSAIDPHGSVVIRHDDGDKRGGPRRRPLRGRRSRSPPEQQQQEAAERGRGRGRRRGPPSPGAAHTSTAAASAASTGCRCHGDSVLAGAPSFRAAAAPDDDRDVIYRGDGSAVAMGAAQPQSARDVRSRDGDVGD